MQHNSRSTGPLQVEVWIRADAGNAVQKSMAKPSPDYRLRDARGALNQRGKELLPFDERLGASRPKDHLYRYSSWQP